MGNLPPPIEGKDAPEQRHPNRITEKNVSHTSIWHNTHTQMYNTGYTG